MNKNYETNIHGVIFIFRLKKKVLSEKKSTVNVNMSLYAGKTIFVFIIIKYSSLSSDIDTNVVESSAVQ